MKDIRTQMRQFVIDNFLFGAGTVADDESFLNSGIIDSTGVLEVVAFLEMEHGISINDADLIPANLDSINGIVRFVESKTGVPSLA